MDEHWIGMIVALIGASAVLISDWWGYQRGLKRGRSQKDVETRQIDAFAKDAGIERKWLETNEELRARLRRLYEPHALRAGSLENGLRAIDELRPVTVGRIEFLEGMLKKEREREVGGS